jgi:glycosyltransferase involved in cell wall biosynthesis
MAERIAGPAMLALVADQTGPSLWRVFWPFTALQRAGYGAGWDFKDAAGIGLIAPAFDGYVLPRMSWRPQDRHVAEAWFAMIRRAGRFVVYDADDDIFTAAIDARTAALGWTEGKTLAELTAERYERIWAMQQCDGVTVSTRRLATVVRSFTTRPVHVVPNAIDVPWFRSVLQAATRQLVPPTVGWAGGKRPDDDVREMAAAWERIAVRFPAVRFVVQGYLPPIVAAAVPADRLTVLPWLALERYPAGLKEVDVACCAVADDRFNRCKSPIKAYEAALAGAAVVATPTVYGHLIEHGVTGRLAETADEWETAIAAYLASPATRRIEARRLLRVVERRWSLAENLWRWPHSWRLIAEDAATRRGGLTTGTSGTRNVPA